MQSLHGWDVTPREAKAIQERLASQVSLLNAVGLDDIHTLAGIDNTYVRDGQQTTALAAIVALRFPDLTVIETALASRPVTFPYVPGLLSFREIPAVLAAWEQLTTMPDVVLCDGQGYAHPRRIGLASHLGLLLDRPTIGCAKSRLIGTFDEPPRVFGAHTPLVDKDEVIGAAVRTRPRHAPLFVSPGHQVSLPTSIAITLACCRDGRFLPEPTRLAHDAVTAGARAHAGNESG